MIFARNMLAACIFALAFVWACSSAKASPSREGQIRQAIHTVFKTHGDEAVAVAACETGHTFSIWAGYGKHQYLGLYQQGNASRRAYYRPKQDGYWWGYWAQIRAAHRQFLAEGWRPWQCRPDGGLAW